MVVGDDEAGKHTLLFNLTKSRGQLATGESILSNTTKPEEGGINIREWKYAPSGRSDKPITFTIWEFGYWKEYHVIHQCFLTKHSLYLLVWDVQDGKKGVEDLKHSLEKITTESSVIIVGTHLDRIPQSQRKHVTNQLSKHIEDLYRDNSSRYNQYPKIYHYCFVNCQSSQHLQNLGHQIYDFASKYIPGSKFACQHCLLHVTVITK